MPGPRPILAALSSALLLACADQSVTPPLIEHHHHAPAQSRAADNSAAQNKINAVIRQATARYHRVEVAEDDGYEPFGPCVPGMGYHYLNWGLLLNGTVDPARPEILVYEPQKNGSLKLVAAEFMVRAEDWDPYHDEPPMLGSREFDDHRPLGSGGPPFPHYQLHAWVWMNNPDGIYSPFNPRSSCKYAVN
jgi:hypothetical protein